MRSLFPPIALGALLLFLVQPIIAKAILPAQGGAAGVWTACLVFFQCGLLGGYLYAFLLSRLPLKPQWIIHGLMLALSLVFLPLAPPSVRPSLSNSPEMEILLGLSRAIGLPYLLLASTSPLLQAWESQRSSDARVFRWFAISNLGSLLGLLLYPFVIEPFLSLAQQQLWWTACYLAYLALLLGAMLAAVLRPAQELATISPSPSGEPTPCDWSGARALLCVGLPAGSTALLGAATTQISQSGVVVPFLWVLPLTLYLASFVICFQWPGFASPTAWTRIFWASGYIACGLLLWGLRLPIPWQIGGYSFLVLASSMACHAQLHSLRPSPRHLTLYYLLIALGGAFGGAFTGLFAPRLFSEYWEFHLSLGFIVLLLGLCELTRLFPRLRHERYARNVLLPTIVLASLFIVCLLYVHFEAIRGAPVVERMRDFFGVVTVLDDDQANRRLMLHGRTQHGAEPLRGPADSQSTLYFTPQSGVAKAIAWRRERLSRPLRIGVIGLGTGSLLTHAHPGDEVRFYEISPAVDALARRHFSYLKNHEGTVEVLLGDGRQLLAREFNEDGSRQYDVLVIDAFSGDALPMHLLTVEAIRLYSSHLAPEGILAFQITNRYLDLAPILAAGASLVDRRALILENPLESVAGEENRSMVRWCLFFPAKSSDGKSPAWLQDSVLPARRTKPWTDDFGSLWSALR